MLKKKGGYERREHEPTPITGGAKDGAFGSGTGVPVTDEAEQLGIFEDGNVELDGLFGVIIEP